MSKILIKLSKDIYEWVRTAASENPNTPVDVLAKFLEVE